MNICQLVYTFLSVRIQLCFLTAMTKVQQTYSYKLSRCSQRKNSSNQMVLPTTRSHVLYLQNITTFSREEWLHVSLAPLISLVDVQSGRPPIEEVISKFDKNCFHFKISAKQAQGHNSWQAIFLSKVRNMKKRYCTQVICISISYISISLHTSITWPSNPICWIQ